MNIIKRVKAPVRVDFGGGTTDIYPFTKIGGAVLNAAINKYIEGRLIASDKKVGLEYHGNIPTSSGLGTSGVMNLVWLALISRIKNKFELASNVSKLEEMMGIVGGQQDQYTSAFGGINFLEFKNHHVKIKKLNLNKNLIKELESKLVLYYTGKPHFSGDANKKMIENVKKGKTIENLARIRDIAKDMTRALIKKDLIRFAELMNEETKERRKLHKMIVNKTIRDIINKGLKNGAISAKVCGSGAGGSLLFFAENRKKLEKKLGKKVIDFKFDFQGMRWL
jgi:D-glycero-alpha-D-manno-heptose-7-phosphate kinase